MTTDTDDLDAYLAEQLKDPAFAAAYHLAYTEARARRADGGEWIVERGHLLADGAFCTCHGFGHIYRPGASRNVWRGPVMSDEADVTPAPTPPARPGDTRTPTNDGGTQ